MNIFFHIDPMQKYQSAFSQGCKAIQNHSKLQKYFYGLILLFGGALLICLFSQSNHLCCVPMKLLAGKILSETFAPLFIMSELYLLCSSVYWTTFLHVSWPLSCFWQPYKSINHPCQAFWRSWICKLPACVKAFPTRMETVLGREEMQRFSLFFKVSIYKNRCISEHEWMNADALLSSN